MDNKTLLPRDGLATFRSDQSRRQSCDLFCDEFINSIGNMSIMELNQITKVQTLWPQHPPLLKGCITPIYLFKVIAAKVNTEAAMTMP